MTPRVYGTERRERDLLPLTPALSRKGRGSKVCSAASHAASSLATKTDLRTEIGTVKAEITTVKADLYRALWIQWGATVAAVTAVVTISKLF